MTEINKEVKKMEILRTTKAKNADIIEAIAIRTAECFGAMNIANALGSETDSWYLVRNYTLSQLKDEAVKRGLVFTGEHDTLKGEKWLEGTK